MATLNLTDQETYATQIRPKVLQLKSLFDERLSVWNRLSADKKRVWIKSGKDPIMTLGWQMFVYFRDNFFTEVDDG